MTQKNHRAVAPIIATLLMVAIAVVGGILIFVFTQGFFADEQVVGPTVDNIRIFGYDATDGDVDGHSTTYNSGDPQCTTVENDPDRQLKDGDCLTIFVENLGDKPVSIQAVRVFGETYTYNGADVNQPCFAGDNPGLFTILDTSQNTLSIIEPNTQATICLMYEDSSTGQVKVGRTIPVQVETSNGQSSQVNVLNGALRGQQ